MRFLRHHSAGLAVALTCAWALGLAFSGSTDMLFYLAPALLIVVPLVAGRYVGESLVLKLAARGRVRRPRPLRTSRIPRAHALQVPRGTRLIAFSLAERPPPGAVLSLT
jgi:hypothetical protein